MSQVTEQSVRFQTALASIKLIQASAVLDLTEDDFDFLTSNKVWIATDRSRARRWNNSLKTKLSLLPKKLFRIRMSRNFGMKMLTMTNLSTECLIQLTKL